MKLSPDRTVYRSRGSGIGYVTRMRVVDVGVRIPMGVKNFFSENLHRLRGPPSLFFQLILRSREWSGRGLKLTTQFDVGPGIRKSGAIPLLHTFAIVTWAGTLHRATVLCTHNTKQLMGIEENTAAYFKIHVRKIVWENEVFYIKAVGAYNYHCALSCSPFSSHKSSQTPHLRISKHHNKISTQWNTHTFLPPVIMNRGQFNSLSQRQS